MRIIVADHKYFICSFQDVTFFDENSEEEEEEEKRGR